MSILYTQFTQEKKAVPHLTRMILLNMFQIFQINIIIFAQYLKLHKHPDTFIQTCDAMTQTDYTTIRQKLFSKNFSNIMRTPIEKNNLVSYWPLDDNDSTDDEHQKDPPEAVLIQNSLTKLILISHFEAIIHHQIPIATAHHQLSGPITHPSTLTI